MSSPDPLLIVGISILIFVLLIANVYLLVYYQHPEDRNESYLAKILIIFGFQISFMSILMLPVDRANDGGSPSCDSSSILNEGTNTYCGGIDMFNLWKSLFCIISFVLVCLIPFATLYYEEGFVDLPSNSNEKKPSRFWPALWKDLILILFFIIMIIALYFTKNGITNIPVTTKSFDAKYISSLTYDRSTSSNPYIVFPQDLSAADFDDITFEVIHDNTISYQVDFIVYLIAYFSWIGWWSFSAFVGVGLVSLPSDLIIQFVNRPHMLPPDRLAARELDLQDRSNDLMEVVTLFKRDRNTFIQSNSRSAIRNRYLSDRVEINKLSQMIYLLEADIDEFRILKNFQQQYNPLVPIAKLLGGSFFALISILWLLQILFNTLIQPAVTSFLNIYLRWFDGWFPMFGNLTYALFSLYLLACTIIGCFKLSVNCFCCKIHPMKVNGTYTNSFLFNLGVILLNTMPCVHFCVVAFDSYVVTSDIFLIFAVQIKYLHFYTSFFRYNVFIYFVIIIAGLMILYTIYRPREKASSTEEYKKQLMTKSLNTIRNTSNYDQNSKESGGSKTYSPRGLFNSLTGKGYRNVTQTESTDHKESKPSGVNSKPIIRNADKNDKKIIKENTKKIIKR
eukprot:gene11034-14816_t